jgi:hypothetical protein
VRIASRVARPAASRPSQPRELAGPLSTHRDCLDGPNPDQRVPGDPIAVVAAGGRAVRRRSGGLLAPGAQANAIAREICRSGAGCNGADGANETLCMQRAAARMGRSSRPIPEVALCRSTCGRSPIRRRA